MDVTNLADLYSAPAMSWDAVRGRLEQGYTQAPGTGGPNRHSSWLTTINPDGAPHMSGIGTDYSDGTLWFSTSRSSRKGRNLERDARCAVALAVEEFDVVIEGTAVLVTDPAAVAAYAQRAAAGGWPAKVDESGMALTAEYSAQSAGPPPWHVYRIVARAAHAVQTVEPYGATRWRF